MINAKTVLLVVGGGVAAYKCLELIRRLKEKGASVRCVLTDAGAQFVTPLSLSALSEDKVYADLFSLTDESEMGHIRLSRQADLVMVAPATADLLAKMAAGIANDLATTAILATDKPVMVAPAMNVRMWEHAATKENVETLKQRGVRFVGPVAGDMACGEWGFGRMSEPDEILEAIEAFFSMSVRLSGRRALVTSGPTREPIDPVRYISNHSSGKQGHAIARALAECGAATTLVSGPSTEPDPPGVSVVHVESARDMLAACEKALPVDVVVCAAAVCDWSVRAPAEHKIKKQTGKQPPLIEFEENPDILATLSGRNDQRPALVIGFAAETGSILENASQKRLRKRCDWMVANDVSAGTRTFGGESNTVHLISEHGIESWPAMSKQAVAAALTARIADQLEVLA